jgi:uncharacterized protein involved in outer membrane biogenesis
MKKWILRILLVLVILAVVVVVAIGFSLDGAIKKGVETFGPQIAKVDVKLAGVNLSLLSGSGSIKGLVIGNPEGYKAPYAMSVGSSSVSISPGSLLSDKIVVKSIRVEAPEISFELGEGGSNLQRIQANLSSGKPAANSPSKPTEPSSPGKKLQVDEVVVTGGKITLAAAVLGGKLTEAPLPEIHLTNLGGGEEGITAAELGSRILSAIMEGSITVSGDALKKAGLAAIDNATKGANEAANKAANDAVGKAAKGIGDVLNIKK